MHIITLDEIKMLPPDLIDITSEIRDYVNGRASWASKAMAVRYWHEVKGTVPQSNKDGEILFFFTLHGI